ncbi:hypothetical protein CEXT_526581 [Caerostris extrusa]|uniref:Uncharacterized protein n=1 Tax=Caerostris extrusa TaxID=172846 RepID=A0AAV4PWS4_CAEEX|nr:hypothetical protein CEXT_526581 [Caerostris extrusa]
MLSISLGKTRDFQLSPQRKNSIFAFQSCLEMAEYFTLNFVRIYLILDGTKIEDQGMFLRRNHNMLKYNGDSLMSYLNSIKNSVFLTETTYQNIMSDMKKAKMSIKKEPPDYRLNVMLLANKS